MCLVDQIRKYGDSSLSLFQTVYFLPKRGIAIFSYLVNQAHLKNRVIRTKSNTNHLFDMCTFETKNHEELSYENFKCSIQKLRLHTFQVREI